MAQEFFYIDESLELQFRNAAQLTGCTALVVANESGILCMLTTFNKPKDLFELGKAFEKEKERGIWVSGDIATANQIDPYKTKIQFNLNHTHDGNNDNQN